MIIIIINDNFTYQRWLKLSMIILNTKDELNLLMITLSWNDNLGY